MGKYSKKRTGTRTRADDFESEYRRMTGNKRRKKKTTKGNRIAAVVAISIALVAIVIGIAAGVLYVKKRDANGLILDNVKVAGVNVGGMTQKEAIAAVENNYAVYKKTPMIVKVLDSTVEISPSCLGKLDVEAAVKDAFNFGNTGSQSKREQEKQIAQAQGYVVDITPHMEMDTQAIQTILDELGEKYSSLLSQSTYEVVGTKPNQKLVVKLGVPEYGLDVNLLYRQVMEAYSNFVFVVEGQCSMIDPDPIDLEAILNDHYIAPVDATFDSKTYEIVEGIDGYGFDIEKVSEQLKKAKYGSTVEIPFTALPPQVTAKDLSQTLYKDTLATYTAANTSDKNRDKNLQLACEAINGKVVLPGEVFSYNNTLGERTEAKGYRPGKSYSGNETIETIGGGICQVSSSLYYCVLLADLEIVAHSNHGFATSYMPLGMDATVSWGSLDFRFRNTSNHPIRIEASSSGGNTTVTLVGTDDKDYYIKMECDTLNTYDYKLTYRTFSANNPEGYKNGDYIQEPYTGYDVVTYRCKYSKSDDKLISKDQEKEISYRSRDGIVCKVEGSSSSGGIGGSGITDTPGALPPE